MAALKTTTLYFAAGIEAAGATVIGLAAIQALILAFVIFIPQRADILRTAMAQTWNETGQLGAILARRTALNYLLQMAIDKSESRKNSPAVSAFRKA